MIPKTLQELLPPEQLNNLENVSWVDRLISNDRVFECLHKFDAIEQILLYQILYVILSFCEYYKYGVECVQVQEERKLKNKKESSTRNSPGRNNAGMGESKPRISVGIIGFGRIGKLVLQNIKKLPSEVVSIKNVWISSRRADTLKHSLAKGTAFCGFDNAKVAGKSNLLIICVPPLQTENVGRDIREILKEHNPGCCVLHVAAGVSAKRSCSSLGVASTIQTVVCPGTALLKRTTFTNPLEGLFSDTLLNKRMKAPSSEMDSSLLASIERNKALKRHAALYFANRISFKQIANSFMLSFPTVTGEPHFRFLVSVLVGRCCPNKSTTASLYNNKQDLLLQQQQNPQSSKYLIDTAALGGAEDRQHTDKTDSVKLLEQNVTVLDLSPPFDKSNTRPDVVDPSTGEASQKNRRRDLSLSKSPSTSVVSAPALTVTGVGRAVSDFLPPGQPSPSTIPSGELGAPLPTAAASPLISPTATVATTTVHVASKHRVAEEATRLLPKLSPASLEKAQQQSQQQPLMSQASSPGPGSSRSSTPLQRSACGGSSSSSSDTMKQLLQVQKSPSSAAVTARSPNDAAYPSVSSSEQLLAELSHWLEDRVPDDFIVEYLPNCFMERVPELYPVNKSGNLIGSGQT